jgi:hypothetical protein
MTGTHEELARELEAAGVRARSRGAIDVALTALRRAVELSDPSHRTGRILATAELALEAGDRTSGPRCSARPRAWILGS